MSLVMFFYKSVKIGGKKDLSSKSEHSFVWCKSAFLSWGSLKEQTRWHKTDSTGWPANRWVVDVTEISQSIHNIAKSKYYQGSPHPVIVYIFTFKGQFLLTRWVLMLTINPSHGNNLWKDSKEHFKSGHGHVSVAFLPTCMITTSTLQWFIRILDIRGRQWHLRGANNGSAWLLQVNSRQGGNLER